MVTAARYDAVTVEDCVSEAGSSDPTTKWQLVTAAPGECCRWRASDGRWISIELGKGPRLGRAIVRDSTGREEETDSYEGALALARTWRAA
jgi:hypothetical protein